MRSGVGAADVDEAVERIEQPLAHRAAVVRPHGVGDDLEALAVVLLEQARGEERGRVLVEVGRQVADAKPALVDAAVGLARRDVEPAHPGFRAAALLGTRGRLAEQHEGGDAGEVRRDGAAHPLLGGLERSPVAEPAAQLQALRDREPVTRVEPHRLVVGLQRVGQLRPRLPARRRARSAGRPTWGSARSPPRAWRGCARAPGARPRSGP